MKFKLSDKTSRFAKRTLADFSERMIVMLADMPLEEISVQKICDICNSRSLYVCDREKNKKTVTKQAVDGLFYIFLGNK